MQLPEAANIQLMIKPDYVPSTAHIEQTMAAANIFTMASGQVGDELKFYFHS